MQACLPLLSLYLAHPFFFFNDTATTEIYTLSLHVALPIFFQNGASDCAPARAPARSPASMRVRSSDSAPCDPASARAANARSSGHTTTAARRYHLSSVLP